MAHVLCVFAQANAALLFCLHVSSRSHGACLVVVMPVSSPCSRGTRPAPGGAAFLFSPLNFPVQTGTPLRGTGAAIDDSTGIIDDDRGLKWDCPWETSRSHGRPESCLVHLCSHFLPGSPDGGGFHHAITHVAPSSVISWQESGPQRGFSCGDPGKHRSQRRGWKGRGGRAGLVTLPLAGRGVGGQQAT